VRNFSDIRNEWFVQKIQGLESSGTTQAEIARRLGVLPQYLTPILKGKRNASENLVLKFCEVFEINQNDLLSKMKVYETTHHQELMVEESSVNDYDNIPLIPVDAMAGHGIGECSVMESEVIDRYVVPEFKRKGVEYMIRVSGSSMYPKYSNGDLLACRPVKELTFFQWGKVYVLDTDQGAIVKRLFPCENDEKFLECRSDNAENYPPFKIPKTSIRSVALVIGVIRLE